jgi:hypothetical protein
MDSGQFSALSFEECVVGNSIVCWLANLTYFTSRITDEYGELASPFDPFYLILALIYCLSLYFPILMKLICLTRLMLLIIILSLVFNDLEAV